MAFQHDYVLRMIEMMGDFFRTLLDKVDEKEKKHALNAFLREYCGMDLESARKLSIDTLQSLLTDESRFVLSELALFYAQSIQNEEKRKEEMLFSLRILYTLSHQEEIVKEKKTVVKELSYTLPLTADDYICSAEFFYIAKEYAWVEDMVFFAIEEDAHELYIKKGIALFSNILVFPEDVLLVCGTTKKEAEKTVQELQNMLINKGV